MVLMHLHVISHGLSRNFRRDRIVAVAPSYDG